MARGRADIANTAIRIFLQEIGVAYDRERGLEPWNVRKHFSEVRAFFDDRCCYCNIDFGPDRQPNQDHLVPINRTDLGLHAWGNIVPACALCNNARQRTDWRDYIIARTDTGTDAKERHARVRAFLKKYSYDPPFELKAVGAELYEEVGLVSMALIEAKIARTQSAF